MTFLQVNLKVGQGLASTINKGEKATYATKEKLGMSLLESGAFALLSSRIEEGQNYVKKKAGDVREIVRSMKISHEFP